MPRALQDHRRLVALGARILVLALVVWCVWATLRSGVAQLERADWRANWVWLVAAGGLYLLGLLPAGLYWRRVLAVFGQRPPLGATLRAYYVGHLGKYVPGKAMVLVLRSGLLLDWGVRAGPAVVSIFIETLTMMAVGAFLAATIGAFILGDQPGVVLAGVLLMVAAGLPTLPPVLLRLFRRRWAAVLIGGKEAGNRGQGIGDRGQGSDSTKEGGTKNVGICGAAVSAALSGRDARTTSDTSHDPERRLRREPDVPKIRWRLIALGWVLNIVGWFVLGTSLWAVLRSLDPANAAPLAALPHYTAAVALAMVAGFLSGLPGGIGVRDGILIAVLATIVPEQTAIVASVLLRLDWLLSELLVSGMLYFGGKGGRGADRAPRERPEHGG